MKKKKTGFTKKTREGIGVNRWTFINDIAFGRWPFRAPTKNKRDEANIAPFNAPNVEQATKTGIIQDIDPNNLSPKVCKNCLFYSENSASFLLN